MIALLVLVQTCHLSHAWTVPPNLSTSTTRLHHRRNNDDDNVQPLISRHAVRFLGRGSNAVVRPGCVLVAPKQEFHHYYRQAAIFVHAMGVADDGSGDYVIRGLILDHPTPFTLAEMMDHQPAVVDSALGTNFLFRGGDKGGDGVILLHSQPHIGNGDEIGTSGLYQGGWQEALAECFDYPQQAPPLYKAFFNYCEFTEQELEDLMDCEEEGDAWMSVEVPADFVLNQDFDRGDAWAALRNVILQVGQS